MTADNITADRLEALAAILSTAYDTVYDMYRDAKRGEIDPAEAAAIVNETITNLTNEAR